MELKRGYNRARLTVSSCEMSSRSSAWRNKCLVIVVLTDMQHCSAELSFSFFLLEIWLAGSGTDNTNLIPEQDERRL